MRSSWLLLVSALIPTSALAQVQDPYAPPPSTAQGPQPQRGQPQTPPPQYSPSQYPQQQQYPQGQQYPQNQYPQYPQSQPYPQPQYQQPAPAPQPQPAARPSGRLSLSTHSKEIAGLITECANAIDNNHPDIARSKCHEAESKEDGLAFAHYLTAQVETPDVAARELQRAAEIEKSGTVTRGERLFIDAWRAVQANRYGDAQRLYDELGRALNNDARALVARGRFRHELLGDAEGAAADFQRVVTIDAKYPAAYGFLGGALDDLGKTDEAQAAFAKYIELAPKEPNAPTLMARHALRKGTLDEAVAQAKKALALDPKFAPALATLGDALQFSGRGKEARRAYAAMIASDDPAVHHDGTMRDARSFLFDNRGGDAERALVAEADLASKSKRPGDQADALVELARMQLDRGAVTEAGQSLRQSRQVLENAAQLTTERERQHLLIEGLHVRAMVLAAIGERPLAEARADEMGSALRLAGDAHAQKQVTALKGWIAARNGDDKTALAMLGDAERPTMKMALALAAARASDGERAHQIMAELAKRTVNDLEGALTRSRAQAWLKSHPASSNASTPVRPATSSSSVVL